MANEDIRLFAKEKGVFLWEIANYLGVSEPTMTRKMRGELPESEKEKLRKVIKYVAEEKKKE